MKGQLLGRRTYFHFALPSLIVLALILFYPLGYAIYLSFFRYSLGSVPKFAGFQNYIRLFRESDFVQAIGTSALFTGIVVSVQLVLGLIIALLLDKISRGRRLFTILLFLPIVVTPSAAGLILKWMFVPDWGMVNYFLGLLNIPPPNWFDSPTPAFIAVTLADIWQYTPFVVIVMFAGLQSIPEDFMEAAKIDGASGVRMLFAIILPILRPLILFVVMMRTMDAWRIFDKIFVITGGGPGTATETLTLYNYRVTFNLLRIGMGSAIGVWTLIFLLGIIGVYLYFLYRQEQWG